MGNLKIGFWDNEQYNYPLLEIDETKEKEFKEILKEYQKDEEYNFDDFVTLLESKGIKVKLHEPDISLFF